MKMDIHVELRNGILELIEKKKITDEKELNIQIPVIIEFISSKLLKQKELVDCISDDRNDDWIALNGIFYSLVKNG